MLQKSNHSWLSAAVDTVGCGVVVVVVVLPVDGCFLSTSPHRLSISAHNVSTWALLFHQDACHRFHSQRSVSIRVRTQVSNVPSFILFLYRAVISHLSDCRLDCIVGLNFNQILVVLSNIFLYWFNNDIISHLFFVVQFPVPQPHQFDAVFHTGISYLSVSGFRCNCHIVCHLLFLTSTVLVIFGSMPCCV